MQRKDYSSELSLTIRALACCGDFAGKPLQALGAAVAKSSLMNSFISVLAHCGQGVVVQHDDTSTTFLAGC